MTENPQISQGEEEFIIDGHVDAVHEMFESHSNVPFEELSDLPVTLEKMKSANVLAAVFALYCPDIHNGAESSGFLSRLVDYAEKYLTGLLHIKSARDLNDCIRQKRPGMIWLIENADGLLEFDRAKLARAGIRVAGLTHQGKNRIGDGNNVPFPEGLTGEGKALVKELAGEGFAFDTAHLAEPGFRDLARICEGPLISSHTGVRALADIPRNLTRNQVAAILERKGVIGIAADPAMLTLSGKASIQDIFRHIDWIAQSFDVDGIAIGTDFCGFFTPNAGFEEIARMPDLARIMREHGYPQAGIKKIMGENWRGFYESLLH
ncbi:MAG TPA: membrane dipeptidase [Syntrophobacteraceae bacterium]|nr:membrane dipeptidase [Syntrophobacteraceae bacterium]